MAGHDVVAGDYLFSERNEGVAARRARVECRIVRRFAMPEAVHGKHVVALGQLGQYGSVVFPFHALPVHEQKRWPTVRPFRVIDRRVTHFRLLFDEASIERASDGALVGMQVVVTVYDDTDVKAAIADIQSALATLQEKEDKDTVYDDTAIRTAIDGIQAAVAALEAKEDKDTVYDDTAVQSAIADVQSAISARSEGGQGYRL